MKRNLLAMVAIVLGLGFSAFTLKGTPQKVNDQSTYYFFGTMASQQSNPNFYNQTPINCAGSALRCEILATPQASDPSHPDLSKPITVVSTKN